MRLRSPPRWLLVHLLVLVLLMPFACKITAYNASAGSYITSSVPLMSSIPDEDAIVVSLAIVALLSNVALIVTALISLGLARASPHLGKARQHLEGSLISLMRKTGPPARSRASPRLLRFGAPAN